jgi:hypothetical protein
MAKGRRLRSPAYYRTDGWLDTTFDGDGKVLAQHGGRSTFGNAVAVDGQNRVVVAGEGAASDGIGINDDGQIIYRGDSGGPCFVDDGTRWRVAGISSYGSLTSATELAASSFWQWADLVRAANP